MSSVASHVRRLLRGQAPANDQSPEPVPSAPLVSVALVVTAVVAWSTTMVLVDAQGRSGPHAVNACTVATQAELEAVLGKKVKSQPVPASQPASLGVSVCMWATGDGRRTLSVATYAPEAVQRTSAKDLKTYYESMKTSNASLARKPAIVLPGVARHASYFVNPRNTGADVVLVLRRDCVVIMNVAGLTREEAEAAAKAAGN